MSSIWRLCSVGALPACGAIKYYAGLVFPLCHHSPMRFPPLARCWMVVRGSPDVLSKMAPSASKGRSLFSVSLGLRHSRHPFSVGLTLRWRVTTERRSYARWCEGAMVAVYPTSMLFRWWLQSMLSGRLSSWYPGLLLICTSYPPCFRCYVVLGCHKIVKSVFWLA